MLDMYKGVVNSPETTITNDINNTDTIIYVLDETRVPTDLPNLMTLGTGTNSETVKILSITGNAITVVRGFQGVAKSWNAGTIIARNFTEYDYNALKENIT
ncbi:MAG TPA: phage tail protein, partial [Clostridiales bacterium]|nr:phage tail protein [Clostridiales bacterium]